MPLSTRKKKDLNLGLCTCWLLAAKSSEDLYGIGVVLICWEDFFGSILCPVSTSRETWTSGKLLTHWTYPLTRYLDKVYFACDQKPNSCSFFAIMFPFDITHFTSLLWISFEYCCKKPSRFPWHLLLFLSYSSVILVTEVYGDCRSNLH